MIYQLMRGEMDLRRAADWIAWAPRGRGVDISYWGDLSVAGVG